MMVVAEAKAAEIRRDVPRAALQVFKSKCVGCHQSDGKGESFRENAPQIPDFSDPAWHEKRPDHELSNSIVHGRGKMKAMGTKLEGVAPEQLVALVRKFQEGPPPELKGAEAENAEEPKPSEAKDRRDPKTASAGWRTPETEADRKASAKALATYRRLCQSCHSHDGTGAMRDTFPALPNFKDPNWHSKKSEATLAVSILNGKNSEMPSFRDRVDPATAKELVAFVRGLNPNPSAASPSAKTPEVAEKFDERFEHLQKKLKRLGSEVEALGKPKG